MLQGSLLSKNEIHSCSCVAQKYKEKHNGSKLTCQNPSEIFHKLSIFLFSQPFLCHRGMHEDGRILYSKQQSHYYTRYKPQLHKHQQQLVAHKYVNTIYMFLSIFSESLLVCYKNFKRITCRKIMSGCWLQMKYISIIHCITYYCNTGKQLTQAHICFSN